MPSSALQPIATKQRIQLLDVLRGFAILGIFIMNLQSFTFYFSYTKTEKAAVALSKYDGVTEFFHTMLFEGKFYSIFSLLFGIGFAIYLAKAEENKQVLSLFRRRLFFLLLIGLMHLLLWVGDIVAFYAMLGFLLIPFRKLSNKTLLIIVAVCILSPIGWYALKMSNPEIFNLAQWPFKFSLYLDAQAGITSEEEYLKAISGDNFLYMLRLNFDGIFWRYSDLIFQSRIFKVFGMFLLGLVIGRTKFFNRLQENKKLLWKIFIIGAMVGLPANFLLHYFEDKGGYYQLTLNGLYQTIAYSFGVAPLALSYVALFALLYQKIKWKRILNVMAPVGKMALSNYFMHTIIGLFVFTRLGLGVRDFGPTAWTIFAVCIFIFQIIISSLWLRFFNYGPMEWLWRSATYGRWQKLRRQQPPKDEVAVSL